MLDELGMFIFFVTALFNTTDIDMNQTNTTEEPPEFKWYNESCVGACAWAGYDWGQRNGSKSSRSKEPGTKPQEPGQRCGGIGEIPCDFIRI